MLLKQMIALADAGFDEVLRDVESLQVYRNQKSPTPDERGASPAPHKPLLLLLALRLLLLQGKHVHFGYGEIEHPLRELLVVYGAGKSQHPEYPYVRLAQSPRLWQVDLPPSASRLTQDVSGAYLLENNIRGGFPKPTSDLLLRDGAAPLFARQILKAWFPHLGAPGRYELAAAVGLADVILA